MLDLCDPKHAPSRCWEHEDCREHPELALACGPKSHDTPWSDWEGTLDQDGALSESAYMQALHDRYPERNDVNAILDAAMAVYPTTLPLTGPVQHWEFAHEIVLECAIPTGAPFEPCRVVLPHDIAAQVVVEDIQCDGVSQFAGFGPVPGPTFGPDAFTPDSLFDTCYNLFTVRLRNVGGDLLPGALLLGRFV